MVGLCAVRGGVAGVVARELQCCGDDRLGGDETTVVRVDAICRSFDCMSSACECCAVLGSSNHRVVVYNIGSVVCVPLYLWCV